MLNSPPNTSSPLGRASIRAHPRLLPPAASVMGLELPNPLLDRSVPIQVAKYLTGSDEMRLYREVKAGTLPLAKPSPTGRKRIALRTLAERGLTISDDAVATAERLFARDIEVRNAKLKRRPDSAPG